MAGQYNLEVRQGATFSRTITWKDAAGAPINLTGYTAQLQARAHTENDDVILINLVSPASGLVLGGVLGTIVITIEATVTQDYEWAFATYELLLTPSGGAPFCLLEGLVHVTPGVVV